MKMSRGPETLHRFDSLADIRRFWIRVGKVGSRRNREKARREERYCLALYMLARATNNLIEYPISVEEGQSPDFMVSEGAGDTFGLEVTQATTPEHEERLTHAEKSGASVLDLGPEAGWLEGQRESLWIERMKCAVMQKLELIPGYRKASRHDLLIYDNTPLIGVNRDQVTANIRDWIREYRSAVPSFGFLSIIISLDVVLDVGGECRMLPFINWSQPERTPDFARRVEHAAKKAAHDVLDQPESR
jgi:hypothetical protein